MCGIRARNLAPGDSLLAYICPICLSEFSAQSDLTFEHAPPKALGGKPIILTCISCNNVASAKGGVDIHAANAEKTIDFISWEGSQFYKAILEIGSLKSNVRINSHGGILIYGLPENNSPENQQGLCDILSEAPASGGLSLSVRFPQEKFSIGKTRVSWLRSAYLVAFTTLGYRYILTDPCAFSGPDPASRFGAHS
jgi:hypothetical protein